MAISERFSEVTDAKFFIYPPPVWQVTQPAVTVEFVLEGLAAKCNKYENYQFERK